MARAGGNLWLVLSRTARCGGRLNGIRVRTSQGTTGQRKVPTGRIATRRYARNVVRRTARRHARHRTDAGRGTRAGNVSAAAFWSASGLGAVYAAQRTVFGKSCHQPLHADTPRFEAETCGALLLSLEVVQLWDCKRTAQLDCRQQALLRLLTPLAKTNHGQTSGGGFKRNCRMLRRRGLCGGTGIPLLLRGRAGRRYGKGTDQCVGMDAAAQRLAQACRHYARRMRRSRNRYATTRCSSGGQQAMVRLNMPFHWSIALKMPRRRRPGRGVGHGRLDRACNWRWLIEHAACSAEGELRTASSGE